MEIRQPAQIREKPVTIQFEDGVERPQHRQIHRPEQTQREQAVGEHDVKRHHHEENCLEVDAAEINHGALERRQTPRLGDVRVERGINEIERKAYIAVRAIEAAAGRGVSEFVKESNADHRDVKENDIKEAERVMYRTQRSREYENLGQQKTGADD